MNSAKKNPATAHLGARSSRHKNRRHSHTLIIVFFSVLFRAFEAGLCGVPSYQVNDGSVIWGQDRLNIVADLLCGWEDHLKPIGNNSKL